MIVRLVKAQDLDAVADMAIQLRQDTFWADVNFDMDHSKIVQFLWQVLSSNPLYVCYVAEVDSNLVGVCAGHLSSHPLTLGQVPLVIEWLFWVEPAYRNGRLGGKLWNAVQEYGKQYWGAKGAVYYKQLKSQPKGPWRGTEMTMMRMFT